jgi:hypothetical protein
VNDKVYEGMITVGPHRTTGSVQAIVNPIFVLLIPLYAKRKRHPRVPFLMGLQFRIFWPHAKFGKAS